MNIRKFSVLLTLFAGLAVGMPTAQAICPPGSPTPNVAPFAISSAKAVSADGSVVDVCVRAHHFLGQGVCNVVVPFWVVSDSAVMVWDPVRQKPPSPGGLRVVDANNDGIPDDNECLFTEGAPELCNPSGGDGFPDLVTVDTNGDGVPDPGSLVEITPFPGATLPLFFGDDPHPRFIAAGCPVGSTASVQVLAEGVPTEPNYSNPDSGIEAGISIQFCQTLFPDSRARRRRSSHTPRAR